MSQTSYTPHMGVFQKKKIDFFFEKKNIRPTGGCSPPGVTAGGCRARKKKVPEKS